MLCADDIGNLFPCTDPRATYGYDDATGQLIPLHHTGVAGGGGVPMTTITFALFVWTACLVLCVKLAKHKGYGTTSGVLAGLLFPVIGVIFFALVPPKTIQVEAAAAE